MFRKPIIRILIILFASIVVLASLGWLGLKITEKKEIKNIEKVKEETVDWKTYRNEMYGFEMKYPGNWETDPDFGEEKSYLGGGANFTLNFPRRDPKRSPDAELMLTISRIAFYAGDWETQAYSWFEGNLTLTNPEKIDFKGREAIVGRVCQADITGKTCQASFLGGRTGQRNVGDSLFTTSFDGKWLFHLLILRFEPSDNENYFIDVYKKFLESFNFIQQK